MALIFGPDALRSKRNCLLEFCGPSWRTHSPADMKNLGHKAGNLSEICQTGIPISAYGEQIIASMAYETPKIVGKTNEEIHFVKGQTSTCPSLDREVDNNLSSESNEILAENCHNDQHMDGLSNLTRQKTQKMRLLTELLRSKGNGENDPIRTEIGPSIVIPNMSAGLDTASALCDHMVVQGSPKKHSGSIRGKRKMLQDKERNPLELICPSRLTKKGRVFKRGAETTDFVLGDCESEEDPSTKADFQSDARTASTQHRFDRNHMPSKNKNKKTQLKGGFSPSMHQGRVVPKTNRVKSGHEEKYGASADAVFSNSSHEEFINGRMEPFFRSSLSPQQADKKSSFCKKKDKQVGEVPLGTSVFGEASIMRKDLDIMQKQPEIIKLQSAGDATARQDLDLSLNCYAVARRKENSGSAQIGDETDPLLSQLKGTPREDFHQRNGIMHVGESSVSRKSAPYLFLGRGLLYDLNENIGPNRTSPMCEMQNLVPRVENGSCSRHHQRDFSGSRNDQNTVEVEEQGNDDIPMEIVELMARNQFERHRQDAERNFFFSEQTNEKRDGELKGFPRVHGNGILNSLREENCRVSKPVFGLGMVTTGQNTGFIRQNPANCFSEIHGNHFTLGRLEENSAFAGFGPFSQCKEMQSSGVQISNSGSIRNSNLQNCKWKGEKIESRFSPTKMPILQVHNSFQNGSRQTEEAEHFRSSLIPNQMPYGLNTQNDLTRSMNFGVPSRFSKTVSDARMIGDLDLNFMKLNSNDREKQNTSFDLESFRRASAENPFVCKNRGIDQIDLNAKVSGSLVLHSNETIPAMQLLSLMDAGMKSSSAFSLDGNPNKFFTKPFFPCDHHPKVSLDGTSKIIEKPLFSYDQHSKRGIGAYNDSSRHPPIGKNCTLEKSCECSPAVNAFVSLFQNEGNLKRGTGFTGQVSSKLEERGKAPLQKRGRPSIKSSSTSTNRESKSNPIQDKKKGISGASDNTMMFPMQRHIIIQDSNSTKWIDSEANFMDGTVFPTRMISKNEICSLNRNPADFSIPEAGNVYMISGKDLKFVKKISSKGESGLVNMDGRKRLRGTKHMATKKGHLQHHSLPKSQNRA
ncbi:hypothetical protein U1Q18_021759 [Sarracenia purpurea var. burkii]